MSNIQQYWKAVRVLAGTLPEFVWLVDAARVGETAVVTQVAAEVAAKLIHAKTHRVATEDEVAGHREQEAAANKSARRERLRRSGLAVVAVDGDEEESSSEAPTKRRRR